MSFIERFPVKRKQKDSKWSFLMREPIFDLMNPSDIYLDRLWLVRTPWVSVALHKINGPDNDRDPHNHPWRFVSLVLRGGYREHRLSGDGSQDLWDHPAGRINYMGLESFHSIGWLFRVPTYTLVVMGPKVRRWGYWVDGEFVDHDSYHKAVNPDYEDTGVGTKETV